MNTLSPEEYDLRAQIEALKAEAQCLLLEKHLLQSLCGQAAEALAALERFGFYCYSCEDIKALVDKLRKAA